MKTLFRDPYTSKVRVRGLMDYGRLLELDSLKEFEQWALPENIEHPIYIDLGSGFDNALIDLRNLIKNRKYNAIGIDRFAYSYYPEHSISDFRNLPFTSNSIDRISSVMAFGWYAKSPEEFKNQLVEIARILKYGGKIRFSCRLNWQDSMDSNSLKLFLDNQDELKVFSTTVDQQYLSQLGLRVTYINRIDLNLSTVELTKDIENEP